MDNTARQLWIAGRIAALQAREPGMDRATAIRLAMPDAPDTEEECARQIRDGKNLRLDSPPAP